MFYCWTLKSLKLKSSSRQGKPKPSVCHKWCKQYLSEYLSTNTDTGVQDCVNNAITCGFWVEADGLQVWCSAAGSSVAFWSDWWLLDLGFKGSALLATCHTAQGATLAWAQAHRLVWEPCQKFWPPLLADQHAHRRLQLFASRHDASLHRAFCPPCESAGADGI